MMKGLIIALSSYTQQIYDEYALTKFDLALRSPSYPNIELVMEIQFIVEIIDDLSRMIVSELDSELDEKKSQLWVSAQAIYFLYIIGTVCICFWVQAYLVKVVKLTQSIIYTFPIKTLIFEPHIIAQLQKIIEVTFQTTQ